ncbi:hypothetical protein SRABI44_01740 [Microbacterium foliorum]|nr:hypothetical protein SRABI44_01740 [Microbacterium foliorum]
MVCRGRRPSTARDGRLSRTLRQRCLRTRAPSETWFPRCMGDCPARQSRFARVSADPLRHRRVLAGRPCRARDEEGRRAPRDVPVVHSCVARSPRDRAFSRSRVASRRGRCGRCHRVSVDHATPGDARNAAPSHDRGGCRRTRRKRTPKLNHTAARCSSPRNRPPDQRRKCRRDPLAVRPGRDAATIWRAGAELDRIQARTFAVPFREGTPRWTPRRGSGDAASGDHAARHPCRPRSPARPDGHRPAPGYTTEPGNADTDGRSLGPRNA